MIVANPGYDGEWTTELEEVSMGAFRVTMRHRLGVAVERTIGWREELGDEGLLLDVRKDADDMNARLAGRARTRDPDR